MKHFAANNIPHAVINVAFADADLPAVDVPVAGVPVVDTPAVDAPAIEVPAIELREDCPTDDYQTVRRRNNSFSPGVMRL